MPDSGVFNKVTMPNQIVTFGVLVVDCDSTFFNCRRVVGLIIGLELTNEGSEKRLVDPSTLRMGGVGVGIGSNEPKRKVSYYARMVLVCLHYLIIIISESAKRSTIK